MSPDSEDPTVNLPNRDNGDDGKKVPEPKPPVDDEDIEDTIMVGGESADQTVVTGADDEATICPEGDTAPPPAAAPSSPPAAGEAAGASHVFANRFEVVALLGEGGMGRVYQVRDRQIEGREVALKVLRPRYSRNARFRDLFFQEIRAAQKFVSEQVNQVRDTGQMEDGRLFLTMDMVIGEDLHALMKREKSLNTRHALEIVRQMLLALQSGHEQGFVHRDVKPPNVMLASQVSKTDDNPYGVGVRLLDFGIAALAAEVGEGKVAGTLQYMSPEQASGQRLDARSDLFSVGIVLYEMLSGTKPFVGATLQEISTALVETQVAPMIKSLDHLKPAVQKILRKALEKDREKRYQSAGEFIAAIEGSKAYRVPTGVPGWVGGLLVLSMVAAAGEGGLIYIQSQELNEKREELRLAGDVENKALIKAQSLHASEMKEAESDYTNLQASLNKEIRDLREQITNQGFEETGEKLDESVLEQMRRELTDSAAQRKVLNDKILALEAAKDKALAEAAKLREDLSSTQRKASPEAMAAEGLDRILEAVAAGYWDQVVDHERKLDTEGVYKRVNIGGSEELALFAQSAEKLNAYDEQVEATGARDKELLEQARALAQQASEAQGRLETASRAWIDFDVEGKDAAPDRLTAYNGAINKLLSIIDARISEHEAILIADSEEVINGPADQTPNVVIAMGEDLGWEKLDAFLLKLEAFIGTAERDGKLDLSALSNNPVLDDWGRYVTGSKSIVPEKYADPIRWFYWAKRWYVDRDMKLGGLGLEGLPKSGKQPISNWRAVLALQTELLAMLPTIADHARFYREQLPNGQVFWAEDRVSGRPTSTDSGGRKWTIDRTTYDPDMDRTPDISYEFTGGALYGPGGAQLVDLFSTECKLAWWAPPGIVPTDNFRRFPNEDEVKEFTAKYPSPGVPCLVFVDENSMERWFSPALGPVYNVSDEPYTRELFFR